jgi:hypothetical protein
VRAVDYFDALCEQEAGEYLFKSVENVDGVRLTRTPPKLSRQGDLGPLGSESVYGQYEEPEGSLLGSAPSYRFVERPIRSDEQARFPAALYLRIGVGAERTAANLLGLDKSPIATMSARYGFLWRGTEHLNDRENGIVGGDWIVLDFQTQSVLAVARAFARYEVDKKMKDLLQFKYFACKNVDATKLSKRTLIPSAQRRSSMSPNNLLQATRDKLRAPEHER